MSLQLSFSHVVLVEKMPSNLIMPAARTNGHTSLSHIPIIDISNPDQDTPAKLVDAAATYGFVYIKSVGLDFTHDIVDHVFALVCLVLFFPSGCHQLIQW